MRYRISQLNICAPRQIDHNQAVLDSLAAHVAVLDKAGVIIAVNQPWARFANANGSPSPQAIGVGVNYLAVCDQATGEFAAEAPAVAASLRAVLAGQLDHFSLEYPCHSPTERHWFLLHAAPLADNGGGAVVSHTDITKRKTAEEALQKSEARNRALLEAIPDAMVHLHRDGTYLDVKAPTDFVLAQPIATLIGKKVQDIVDPQLAQQLLAVAQQTLEKGGCQIFEFEIALGAERRIREGRAVPAGAEEVIFILRDITARQQAEAVLRQSEERYRILAELSPDAILVNVDGRYVYASAAALRLFGAQDAQEIIGRSPLDFLAPADHTIVRARMRDVLEQKQSAPLMEYQWQRLDGTLVAVEVAAGPSTWNGQPAIQLVQRDITVRKQAEAEKMRLHAEVSQQRAQLRALTARLAEVQENERKGLARELHDQVGQNLSTLALHLKIIQNQLLLASPAIEPMQTLLNDTQGLIKQTTERVRNVMTELRPPLLDDYGLPAALEWYANGVAKRGNFSVQIEAAADLPRLSAAVENGLFRITQEAITNIMKHAQATSVVINLVVDAQQTALTISLPNCMQRRVPKPSHLRCVIIWSALRKRAFVREARPLRAPCAEARRGFSGIRIL